jgi:hypothetical protein
LIYVMGEEAEKVFTQLTITAPTAEELQQKADLLYDRTVKAFTDYFNTTSNALHYSILLSSCEQKSGQTNEEYIRELYELAGKCDFDGEQESMMIRMRLLAGMRDKPLSRELQLDANVTVETIKTKMRAKETILKNQRIEIDGERSVAAVFRPKQSSRREHSTSSVSNPSGQKSLVKGWGEAEGQDRATRRIGNCTYCGNDHIFGQCPAYGKRCNKCKAFNHFAKVCNNSRNTKTVSRSSSRPKMHACAVISDTESDDDEKFYVYSVNESEWRKSLYLNDSLVSVKIDTGAEVNVIPKSVLKEVGQREATKSKASLVGFTGHKIPVIGKTSLKVSCVENPSCSTVACFYIVEDEHLASTSTLLGLHTVRELHIVDCGSAPEISEVSESVDCILENYRSVFEGLGRYSKPISLQLKPTAVPKAVPPRRVPHGKRLSLKAELDSLVSQGVIVPDSEPSEWLCPLVLVAKPNGSTRICLDPAYLNTQLIRSQCHIPTATEIFANVHGSRFFSCLDAKQGFHQICLDEQSSRLFCFVTPFGKYSYVRLPMGTCNAPELFHQIMADTLKEIPGVLVYIDDVLVHAASVQEHNQRLRQVLSRLKEAGLTMNRKKSVFLQEKVNFLGHTLTGTGVQPQRSKIEAVLNMVVPADKEAVQRYLGFITYLAKFIPNLSELTYPMREVCKKDREFIWEAAQADAFEKIRRIVTESPELALYDPLAPITIQCDASAHALGAVIMQSGRPIEFVAKSLSASQQNYSQVEKEFLAVVFACKRFQYYIVGRGEITVETDHKPLLGIMKKEVGVLTPRLAKMRLQMMSYPNVELEYKPGKDLVLADTLSRSCPPDQGVGDKEVDTDPMSFVVCEVFGSVDATERYKNHTATDEELSVVTRLTQCGWPRERKQCAARALPYWNIRHSLSVADGLLFYGCRLVVPNACRAELVNSLHSGHQGVTKTLQRARSSVYWPGLRKRLEEKCMSCEVCLSVERANTKEPLMSMPVPEFPFEVIGVDPFEVEGRHFLAVVDYLTKWPVIRELQVVQSDSVIRALGEVFADFGLPSRIISDNGPQLTSRKFKEFVGSKGIEHVTSSPLHPSGNGQVERCIGTIKSMMKKMIKSGGEYWEGLLAIRNTPVDDGLPSPAQLLQGRVLRDGLPVSSDLHTVKGYDLNDIKLKLEQRQSRQKYHHDRHSRGDKSSCNVGDRVYFRTARGLWVPGYVSAILGNRSYIIESGGLEYRRNRVDIRHSLSNQNEALANQTPIADTAAETQPETEVSDAPNNADATPPTGVEPAAPVSESTVSHTTRFGREVRPPRWLQDYVV